VVQLALLKGLVLALLQAHSWQPQLGLVLQSARVLEPPQGSFTGL
jgi:hypothetical protein